VGYDPARKTPGLGERGCYGRKRGERGAGREARRGGAMAEAAPLFILLRPQLAHVDAEAVERVGQTLVAATERDVRQDLLPAVFEPTAHVLFELEVLRLHLLKLAVDFEALLLDGHRVGGLQL